MKWIRKLLSLSFKTHDMNENPPAKLARVFLRTKGWGAIKYIDAYGMCTITLDETQEDIYFDGWEKIFENVVQIDI